MSRLLSNEWYYENSAGVILTREGEHHVESQLNDSDVCHECGSQLFVCGMIEGTFIACVKDIYHKFSGYKIDKGDYTTPPLLVRPDR